MPQAVLVPLAINFALMAASYAYQKFSQKPTRPGDRDFQINITDTRQYLRVLYGRNRVGVDIVFHDVDPSDDKSWWVVGAVCLGEIEEFERMFFDDRLVIDWENDTGFLHPFDGKVSVAKYTGTDDQTAKRHADQ